ncbi:MAG: F0F1 ATP synthase subunit beta, partial [Planctomycetaceae bacterium]
MEGHPNGTAHQGTVIAIRGSVVDARFAQPLPALYHVLRAGDQQHIVIEVITHLDVVTVRGIALTSTRGLARGSAIVDTGQPLQVPVGRRVLGRVFDVFGATIDGQPALTGGEWRSIHRQPVPLAQQATTTEVFETGIKAIDLL